MKQIINQNIQFIEYSGRPSSLIFSAIFNNAEWLKPILDNITAKYTALLTPLQQQLTVAQSEITREKSLTPQNQTNISNLQNTINGLTSNINSLNAQMQNEISKAQNEPPSGDSVIKPNNVVWVNHPKYKGAYLTQKAAWIIIPSVTNLYSKGGKKLYGTDQNNPAYMVNNLSNPTDNFNQIPRLISNEGYILLSQIDKPYMLYEYQNLDNTNTNPHIIFNIPKCMEDNGILTSNFVDNINKVLTFDELLGVCDNFEQASILLSFDVYNLRQDTTYSIRINSANTNISIENEEFILDNFDSKQKTFSTHIKFLNEISRNIFHIYVSLYDNNLLIDKDVVSIFVNCPRKPEPTPLPPKVKASISII